MSAPIRLTVPATRDSWEVAVLYEDEHLLAVEKPPFLLTSPDRCDLQLPNMMRLLHTGIREGKPWATERDLSYLANTHRLDRETTGVLLLARSKTGLAHLADQFGAERPTKTYVALAHGAALAVSFRVDARLAPHPQVLGTVCVDSRQGKKSISHFQVVESFRGYSLVQCRPLTDRAHQIRVHLQQRRMPVVGDELYGGKPLLLSELKPDYRFKPGVPEKPLIGRVALHLQELAFAHPVTGQPMRIRSPLPRDFEVGLKYLRRFGSEAAAHLRPDF